MASLNDKIIAYLTINNIAFVGGDYQTGQPEGEEDQVLTWDVSKLGTQPTYEQIDDAHETYQTQRIAEQATLDAAKQQANAKLLALGLTVEELKILIG